MRGGWRSGPRSDIGPRFAARAGDRDDDGGCLRCGLGSAFLSLAFARWPACPSADPQSGAAAAAAGGVDRLDDAGLIRFVSECQIMLGLGVPPKGAVAWFDPQLPQTARRGVSRLRRLLPHAAQRRHRARLRRGARGPDVSRGPAEAVAIARGTTRLARSWHGQWDVPDGAACWPSTPGPLESVRSHGRFDAHHRRLAALADACVPDARRTPQRAASPVYPGRDTPSVRWCRFVGPLASPAQGGARRNDRGLASPLFSSQHPPLRSAHALGCGASARTFKHIRQGGGVLAGRAQTP